MIKNFRLLVKLFCFFIILCCFTSLKAQKWVADWTNKDELLQDHWRFDITDFICGEGVLDLNSDRTDLNSTTMIVRLLPMSQEMKWRFTIRLDKEPTRYFYPYILMAKLQDKNNYRQYIAIRYTKEKLSLVTLWHKSNGKGKALKHTLFDIKEIEEIGRIPALKYLDGHNLSVQVIYRKSQGWQIDVYAGSFDQNNIIQRRFIKNYKPTLSDKGWIGFAINHSKSSAKSFHCSYIEVDNLFQNTPEPVPSPTPIEDKDDTVDTKAGHHIVINEFMASPESGKSEYVELYNPTDKTIHLKNYFLVYSRDGLEGTPYSLSIINDIKPKSYVVLTANKTKLLEDYTETPIETVYQISMPQLANKGFVLALGYKEDQVFDEVKYTYNIYPVGYKSKKGLAVERIDPMVDNSDTNWTIGSKKTNFRTPGMKNDLYTSTRPTPNPTPTPKKKKGGSDYSNDSQDITLDFLWQIVEQEPTCRFVIHLYRLDGFSLISKKEDEAKTILKKMVDEKKWLIDKVKKESNGFGIIVIDFIKTKQKRKHYVIKFRCN